MASLEQAAREIKGIARDIRTMDRRADNLEPVWRKAGSRIARETRRQFATRGAYHGTKWKPLKMKTMKEKLRLGLGRAPLVRSGALKSSFTSRPMGIELYGPHQATFGSNLQTAVWQQEGTFRNGKRAIPPRLILRVSRELRGDIRKMVVDYVTRNKRI